MRATLDVKRSQNYPSFQSYLLKKVLFLFADVPKPASYFNTVPEPHSEEIVFLSSNGDPTVDHVFTAADGIPIPPHSLIQSSGPIIKEISSNCSSLAASPQSNAASPPKLMSLTHRNKSHDSILGSPKHYQPFLIEHQADCTAATTSKHSNSWSDLPEYTKDVSQCNCKFVLTSDSSEDESIEVDGLSFGSRSNIGAGKIYNRSISCDPVASGEVMLPKENQSRKFTESDFLFKVSSNTRALSFLNNQNAV